MTNEEALILAEKFHEGYQIAEQELHNYLVAGWSTLSLIDKTAMAQAFVRLHDGGYIKIGDLT